MRKTVMRTDAIAIVEAAYELDSDTPGWLSGLLAQAATLLDRGLGLGATLYRPDRGPDESTVVTWAMDDSVRGGLLEAARLEPQVSDKAVRSVGPPLSTATQRERSDDDRALDLWQGLVAGRWSLVDRFDSDGRRFLIARRNDPRVADPRALTLRERQVLAYAAMGHPLKLVAYALGLSVPTVALHRTRGMRKLGLQSHAEVVRFFTQRPPQ